MFFGSVQCYNDSFFIFFFFLSFFFFSLLFLIFTSFFFFFFSSFFLISIIIFTHYNFKIASAEHDAQYDNIVSFSRVHVKIYIYI